MLGLIKKSLYRGCGAWRLGKALFSYGGRSQQGWGGSSSPQRSSQYNSRPSPEEFTAPHTITFKEGPQELSKFALCAKTQKTLNSRGIGTLFPVQAACFDPILGGKNVVTRERTGAGKTLAYALPVLERFRGEDLFKWVNGQAPLKLVLVPTRELAMQVTAEYYKLANFRDEYTVKSFFGGVAMGPQIQAARQGVEVAVATPGRLLALIENGQLSLAQVRTFVLDETDMMLDMGFKDSIEAIYRHMESQVNNGGRTFSEVQHLLFSATLPGWMQEITRNFMHEDFLFVDMMQGQTEKTPHSVTHLVAACSSPEDQITKLQQVVERYCGPQSQFIVFGNTKFMTRRIYMSPRVDYSKGILNSDVGQESRRKTFLDFRNNKLQCLVATDLASRGLDFPSVDLVVMMSAPDAEDRYIHRSGRTGRAGKEGVCVTLYLPEEEQTMRKVLQRANVQYEHVPKDVFARRPTEHSSAN